MHQRKGLTLIELMVAVLIIALLSTIGLVALKDARAKARDARRVYDIAQFAKALTLYAQENSGAYPGQNDYLGRGGALDSLLQKYMPQLPRDPSDSGGTEANSYYYYYVAANSCQGSTLPTVHVERVETSNQLYHQNPCPLGAGGLENGYANQADYLVIIR